MRVDEIKRKEKKKNSDKKSKQKKRRSENPLVYSYKVPKNIMHGPHPIIIYL